MKYFGDKKKHYLLAFLSSSFIVGIVSVIIYEGETSIFLILFAIGWVFLDFLEAYRKTKIPVVVTNENGLKVNFTLIDKKLLKWSDMTSLKKGLLVNYKILHKNGVKVLPINFLNKKNRENLIKVITIEINKNIENDPNTTIQGN